MAEIARAFRTPEAVTSYFDGKADRPAFSWLDVFGEEHAHAFTVAKAVDAELLGTFRKTISTAIAESKSFETWRGEIQDELAKLGWWGPRRIGDPAGADPDKLADFSSRRRLETIFWTNMRTARAAGQWERIQRTKRALPYLLYVRSASAEPRAEHLRFVGIILPVDHPFWSTHFPPNGWGCKCSVRQITRREAEQLLGTEPDPDDESAIRYTNKAPDFGSREFRNRRTGEVTSVPVGIDPGWQTNPGLARSRTLLDTLSRRLEELAQVPGGAGNARRMAKELWSDPYQRLAPLLPEKVWMPAGVAPEVAAATNAVSPIVSIDSAAVAARIKAPDGSYTDFITLPELLFTGVAFQDPKPGEDEANERTVVKRIGKTWWKAVVRRSETGLLRVRSLHQRPDRSVAFEILDAGLGTDGLLRAGFAAEEIEPMVKRWKRQRGEGANPG
ncbi:prophage MuSo2, F protein, putative [Fulvimarina pelagi HTCC2506]|uniref:Prophage MuSo2, F protein, putative n=1 Tax=Fulvimarina pelagi HTCC2506 TaxID=314231 RepID=Q0FYY7_9HYPH|nr:phage minor head protein [Fulvimarina pelagi]EAU40171.1 prophage MuSo2, F protein, putative [Fulvimarina pelagi HTCC2506]